MAINKDLAFKQLGPAPGASTDFDYAWRQHLLQLSREVGARDPLRIPVIRDAQLNGSEQPKYPANFWGDNATVSGLVFKPDGTGGITLVFSDGTSWIETQFATTIAAATILDTTNTDLDTVATTNLNYIQWEIVLRDTVNNKSTIVTIKADFDGTNIRNTRTFGGNFTNSDYAVAVSVSGSNVVLNVANSSGATFSASAVRSGIY